jgi:tetratricopeptide (TPR) repeat protein
MILKRIATTLLALAISAGAISAQSASTKQPKVKSQKEAEAIQAVFQAADPDARIAAAKNLVTKFADTDFKSTAFYIAAFSAQQKGDLENVVVYGDLALEADDKNYGAMILIASSLAQRTREFDLDREEKLGRSEKLAKAAIELIKTAPKPNPGITDEQWENAKKDYTGQAYEGLGMAAMARKNYEACATNLQLAADASAQADPATLVRLGSCYGKLKKYDQGIAALDRAIADGGAAPIVKQAATQEKMDQLKLKAAATK